MISTNSEFWRGDNNAAGPTKEAVAMTTSPVQAVVAEMRENANFRIAVKGEGKLETQLLAWADRLASAQSAAAGAELDWVERTKFTLWLNPDDEHAGELSLVCGFASSTKSGDAASFHAVDENGQAITLHRHPTPIAADAGLSEREREDGVDAFRGWTWAGKNIWRYDVGGEFICACESEEAAKALCQASHDIRRIALRRLGARGVTEQPILHDTAQAIQDFLNGDGDAETIEAALADTASAEGGGGSNG